MEVFTLRLAFFYVSCFVIRGTAQALAGVAADVEVSEAPPGQDAQSAGSAPCLRPRFNKGLIEFCGTQTGTFPAFRATCTCVSCATQLGITCFPDGKWYFDNSSVCAPPKARCGLCGEQKLPGAVRCPPGTTLGYLGEQVGCSCRSNCRTRNVTCGKDGTWRYLGTQDVCTETTFELESTSAHLHVSYLAGTFRYTCSPGYTLQGPTSVVCEDGELSSKPPTCAPGGEEILGTVSIQIPQHERTMEGNSSQNTVTITITDTKNTIIIAISILVVLFGIGLIVMIILWCKKPDNDTYGTTIEMQNYPRGAEIPKQQQGDEPAVYLEPLRFSCYDNIMPAVQVAKQDTKPNEYCVIDEAVYEEIKNVQIKI